MDNNSSSSSSSSSGGIGIRTALFLIFLTLKLTGLIDWSWWWVLSPLWIPAAIGLLFVFIVGLTALFEK